MSSSPHRIVVLGAGFGGMNTVLRLQKHAVRENLRITLVNKTNYFLFSPLLHEVATSGLGHHQVVEAVRELIHRHATSFVQTEALNIDLHKRSVQTDANVIPYDTLVIATGATTNFYGIPGAEEYSLPLKSLQDALAIRSRVVDAFEQASQATDAATRKRLLSFAIIGGGPTGVEVAGEWTDLFSETLTRFYAHDIRPKDVSLTLLTADPELVMPFHPALRHKAFRILKKRGVDIRTKAIAKEITAEGVLCADGRMVTAGTIVWAAGVKPQVPLLTPDVPRGPGGRLLVDPFFRLHKTPHDPVSSAAVVGDADIHTHAAEDVWPHVFALGDVAAFTDSNGKPLPMLAQVAVRQAPILTENIIRSLHNEVLRPFRYHSKGSLVSLGRFQALAQIGPVRLSGPLAWFLWRNAYFWEFTSWSKRCKIAIDWFVDLFFPRDITRA